jgi:fructokinase
LRIGIDLGGTKIEAIALERDGSVLARERIATPKQSYEATIGAIGELVLGLEARLRRTGTVGIGIPGTVSPATGLIKNANSTWLNGRPLDKDLAAALSRQVRLANDANCFALSEAVDGAGAGAQIVFGVILGTGVGAGIAIDRRVLVGRNAIAGEWGHNPLPWPRPEESPGEECWCGKLGCIETWLSGPGFTRKVAKQIGPHRTVEEIASRAAAGDSVCLSAINDYTDRLARALASVVNVLDPDVIVLGGGVSNIDNLSHQVEAQLEAWTFSDSVATPVKRNVHGDSGGVRGAAWLWPEER